MYGKTELDRLRFRIVRLYDSLYDVSSSFDVSLQDAAAALNAGIAANAGALLNVSNSLSVSLKDAKDALQAALEANTKSILDASSSLSLSLSESAEALRYSLNANIGAITDLSRSTSSSLSESAALIRGAITANATSIYNLSSSFSMSLSESVEVLTYSITANASALTNLSQSTSMSLSQSAAALREGLTALGTIISDTSSSLSMSAEESGKLLRKTLTELIDQNSSSFAIRVNNLDTDLNGVADDIRIVSGSYIDFTASTNTFKTEALGNINTLNTFKNDNISKLVSLAATPQQEQQQATNSVGTDGANVLTIKSFNYFSSFLWDLHKPPDNYWAYTVSYPTGANPFSIKSYSYMGTSNGTKYWNLEEAISYSKREYSINSSPVSSRGPYDADNTMNKNPDGSAKILKDSELGLKAGKITLRKGFENTTTPAVEIIGETAETNGTLLDQGQLFIRDEDSTTSGLQIGYRYQLLNSYVDERGNTINDIAQYGRIQAVKSNGATDLYLNPAGGSVRIGRLNDSYLTEGTIELNYYGYGDRNSFIDFHSDNTYGRPGSNTAPTDGDYSGRIIRWSGTDGMMEIVNRGAGGIRNRVINGTGNIFDWYVGDLRLMYLSSGGSLTIAGGYAASSDERIKTDILTSSLGLEFINNLNPVQFKFIVADEIIDLTKEKLENNKIVNDGSRKAGIRNHYGFIAQEVKKAAGDRDFAAVIYEPEKDLYKLNHQEFISPMVKAIQELSTENDYLKSKLEEKDKQINDILSRLAVLENK